MTADDMQKLDAMLADAELAPPTLNVATERKCRRHRWGIPIGGPRTGVVLCERCDAVRDLARSRRGKNNRSRGNAIEREVAAKLGLRRVGQYGGADDVRGALFAGQVKSGLSFPERLWTWLKAVPVDAGQTPILIVTDAPGPGNRRRAVVVVELSDWISLHGPEVA